MSEAGDKALLQLLWFAQDWYSYYAMPNGLARASTKTRDYFRERVDGPNGISGAMNALINERAAASPRGHAVSDPDLCPFCGSPDIEGESVEIEGRQAFQHCTCVGCGRGWTDVYEIEGFVPDESEE